jgi:hypothetical protein
MKPRIIEDDYLDLQKSYPFRIAFLNDLHVGATYGLWPEVWTLKKGHTIGSNKSQRQLLGHFWQFAQECATNKVNVLCVVGDLLTGQNRKEFGKYTMTTDINIQVDVCAYLLSEFVRRVPTIQRIYLFKGTPYHSSLDTTAEEAVGNALKKDYDVDAEYRGEYVIFDLEHNGNVKKLFVTHPASAATMYPEQAMGKDMMLWQEAVGNGKLKPVDFIIRAHKHMFAEVHKAKIRAIQLPCWQYFVPYDSAMKNFARWQPDIGGVLLLLDNKLRTTVWHFLYDSIVDPTMFETLRFQKPSTGVKNECLLESPESG